MSIPAPRLAVAGAGVLFTAAGLWLVLGDFPVAVPGRPTTQALATATLVARPVAHDPFTAFNVNDQNPFIPASDRALEQRAREHGSPVLAPVPPTAQGHQAQPVPPSLPRLPGAGRSGPTATGLLLAKNGPQALLTFPGATHATPMRPGDTVDGWTLVEIRDGNVLHLKDTASGTLQALVVHPSL